MSRPVRRHHGEVGNFLIFASGGTYYDDQLDKIEVAPQ